MKMLTSKNGRAFFAGLTSAAAFLFTFPSPFFAIFSVTLIFSQLMLSQPSLAESSYRLDSANFRPAGERFYLLNEIRHHYSTYYDSQGFIAKREPSMHFRLLAGVNLNEGRVNLVATFGAYKNAQTQQVLQRRPEIEIDFVPFKIDNFQTKVYGLVKLPFSGATDEYGEAIGPQQQGAEILAGIAPLVVYTFSGSLGAFTPRLGADFWLRTYSRKQTFNAPGGDSDFEDFDRDHYSLLAATDESEEQEAYAPTYFLENMVGVDWQSALLAGMHADFSLFYDSTFDPIYQRQEGRLSQHYGAERSSYLRFRLSYNLTESVTLLNDFYGFYDDFYSKLTSNGEQMRYRNVARMVIIL